MRSTSDQSCDRDGPHRLIEPELAAWAEQVVTGSTSNKRGIWYGALAFWIVVICIMAARIAFLDPAGIHPATASSSAPSTLAGASSDSHGTKL